MTAAETAREAVIAALAEYAADYGVDRWETEHFFECADYSYDYEKEEESL